jgi:competence protein ComFC
MTKRAVRKREYNQAELLAKSISKRIDLPVIKNCVLKIKETAEQKSLSRKERVKNLKGCFKVEKASEIKGKKVLLIDDVLTTGATAEAITEKLLKAGADSVYLATVASVEYKLKG